ncbi:MAG: SDR family oxidoreductase [Williamsia sp.]|nr:SDR family oxidoreductase [Williamsia sp.]
MNVIVTGSSKGIGRAIAEKFAAAGHQLYLCARDEVQLKATATALQQDFPASTIKVLSADISQKVEAIRFADWVLQETAASGGPEILVNNAGTFIPGSIKDEEDGTLEKMLAINLYSAYHTTRALLPRMIARGRGHIFNLCSIASLHAYNNGGAYSISKFALLGFSRNLREELKPHGIKVTAVMPGAVYTDSWKESGIPAQRMIEAADIATLVYTATTLSPQATIEDIVIRPQPGDL